MKYIASYEAQCVNVRDAQERHEQEYYRAPGNYSNGTSLGMFVETGGKDIECPWLDQAVSELLAHLRANDCLEVYGEIGPGYTAHISKDGSRVLAESYVASSGNAVVVIHKDEETVLYVNSRRHGIPSLANPFMDMDANIVLFYDSWRDDVPWHAADLEPEPDTDTWGYPEEIGVHWEIEHEGMKPKMMC